jgi:IS1 family transposase/transposase-like protein
MIQTIVTYVCSRCESPNIVRNGHDYKGGQKYHCKACGRYGTLNAQPGYATPVREQARRGLLERLSLRGLERLLALSRRTLQRWLCQWIDELPPLEASLVPAEADDVLELDELWSFVQKKDNQRWLWLALCRRTRQVVAYFIGDRSETSCLQLWRRIPIAYARCHSFSDFWDAYQRIFATDRHQSVGKDSGQTSHVERWFNTLCQRLGRFTRRTLAFSRRDDLHDGLLHLFIHDYNLSCIS